MRRGFTIVELLVYVAITTVAITVFAAFMADITKSASRSRVVKEVEQNAQFVMNKMAQDIRHAQAVASVSPNSLTLTLSPTLNVTYAYDATNYAVTYQENAGTAMAISNTQVRVTSLTFSNIGGAVTVSLSAAQGNPAAPAAGQYNTTLSSTFVVHAALY